MLALETGEKVAWNWGSSTVEGEVADKKTDKVCLCPAGLSLQEPSGCQIQADMPDVLLQMTITTKGKQVSKVGNLSCASISPCKHVALQ